MPHLDRWDDACGSAGNDVLVQPDPACWRMPAIRSILAAGLLAWVPFAPGRADTLPETTLPCNVSHVYENESTSC